MTQYDYSGRSEPEAVRLYLFDNNPHSSYGYSLAQIDAARVACGYAAYSKTYALVAVTAELEKGPVAITIDGHTFGAKSIKVIPEQEKYPFLSKRIQFPITEYDVTFRLKAREGIVYTAQEIYDV